MQPHEQILAARVAPLFAQRYGCTREGPVVAAFAPGVVNLIGDSTYEAKGMVVSAALEAGTLVVGASRPAGMGCAVYSEATQEEITFSISECAVGKGWGGHVQGAVAKYAKAKELSEGFSFSAVIATSIPDDAGVPAFSALVLAVLTFLEELCEKRVGLDKAEMALESGAPPEAAMGLFAAAMGKAHKALLVDCSTKQATLVPFNGSANRILITNTKVDGSEKALSEGCKRAKECEEAAEAVTKHTGKDHGSLREVELSELEGAFSAGAVTETCRKRARHIVTEIERTKKMAEALKGADVKGAGECMFESHASSRDDYEMSCLELDKLVETARTLDGVHGCRMTGGGFGGCVVSLVAADKLEGVRAGLSGAFKEAFGGECVHTESAAGACAMRVDVGHFFPEQHVYECIIRAKMLKEEGNKLLGEGQVKGALDKYHRIHFYVGGLAKRPGGEPEPGGTMAGLMSNKDEKNLTDAEREEVMQLVRGMHMNKSLCYTKLEAWDKGVAAVQKALNFGGDEGKCMYRRGLCNLKLGDLLKARADLERAQQLNKNDASIATQIKNLEKLEKVQDSKAKKTFAKMLG